MKETPNAIPYIKLSFPLAANVVIGVSLSKPHTSELNDAIFIYIIYIYISYTCCMYSVCPLDCNLTQPCAACGLQVTFSLCKLLSRMSSPYTVLQWAKTARRDSWEEKLER